MLSSLDLHQEVARYYEREDTQKRLAFYRVTTDYSLEEKQLMARYMGKLPFATEENWEFVDREVIDRTEALTLPEGDVVYPMASTQGRDYDPPEIPSLSPELYKKLYSWIEDRINHAGIKLTPKTTFFGLASEYNYKASEIFYDPHQIKPEALLLSLFVSYLYSFYFNSETKPPDVEDKIELDKCITVAVYWKLKRLGFDLGEYGLISIIMSFPSYGEYLENDMKIEELLGLLE